MRNNRNTFFYSLSSKSRKLILITSLLVFFLILVLSRFDTSNLSNSIRASSSELSFDLSSIIASPVKLMIAGYNKIIDISRVYQENEELRELQLSESISFQEIIEMKLKIEEYERLLNTFNDNEFNFKTARVISKVSNNYLNSITVTSGQINGIKPGMPILGLKGLVGFVDQVRKNTSIAILLSNISSRIPVSVSNNSYQAIMIGQGFKNPKIVFAKDRDSISVGDTISTSGRGGIFPPFILIGEVSSITNDEIEVKLFEDIENLKKKLGIKQWLVFGGSWGSTLSLAYSQTYPDSVSEMVLRGIFMLREKELKWFYQYGASNVFPEAWQYFLEPIDEEDRHNLISAYHKIFLGDDEEKKLNAAIAWSKWEGSTSSLSYRPEMAESFSEPKFALAFALIENHYFVNKGFLEEENQLIEKGIDIIRSIPTVIVQGRYDMVCPITTAWELSQNWPEAELIIAPSSGHTAFEKEITHELINATNKFGSNND